MSNHHLLNRRTLLSAFLASATTSALQIPLTALALPEVLSKPIPSSGEAIPVVGLGSWITFNVGGDQRALAACTDVVRAFFEAGGRLIDSSPMYGSSQDTIGEALSRLNHPRELFAADKVWTSSGSDGPDQIEETRQRWAIPSFDLLQVHNLLAWERHLDTLFEMKANGVLRYVGVTTSHGRRHGELERILQSQPLDFVQVTYNAANREVEQRILPIAEERGVAVIANRPYAGGRLIRRAKREPLPDWAIDAGATTWADLLLKFISSHPAVNCAIPATTRTDHVRENMGAAKGVLVDESLRRRTADLVSSL